VECRLTCTLVIERERRDPSQIVALLPVWWEFKTIVGTEELLNDFSWCEMLQTVEL
jgi:hypothetical protein